MWSTGIREVFIAQHSIDFRKGAEGLIAECYHMELDPYLGDCVVFLHRSRRSLKVICGDRYGVWVLLRRFEGGAMRQLFPFLDNACFVTASQAELAMLLEGATFEVTSKVRPLKKESSNSGFEKKNMLTQQNESKKETQTSEKRKKGSSQGRHDQGNRLGE